MAFDGPVPLLYNPAAGGGRGLFRTREAEAVLALHDIQVRKIATHHPGHAGPLVRELVEAGEKDIMVVGGDGTVSEAAQGAVGQDVRLGLLPGGTGNDFLRHFGIDSMADAAQRIAEETPRRIDAARVSWTDADGAACERFSINIVATGFAARVADRTNRQYKFLGKMGYSAAVLRELAGLRSDPTQLSIDGADHNGHYPMVAFCNTAYTGGGMWIAPEADAGDGQLDWLALEKVSRGQLLGLFSKIFKGEHRGHPKVHLARGTTFRVEPERPSPILIDGDVLGVTPATVEVVPGALQAYL